MHGASQTDCVERPPNLLTCVGTTLTSPRTNAIDVAVSEHAACATVGGEATQNCTVAAVAPAAPLGTGSDIPLAPDEGEAPLPSPPAPAAAFFFAFAASFCAFFSSRCCSCGLLRWFHVGSKVIR